MKITFKTNVDEVTSEVKNWIVTRMSIGEEYRDFTDEELEAKKAELKTRGIEMFVEDNPDKKYVVNIGWRYIENKEPIILYELTCDVNMKNKEIIYKYDMVL